VTDTLFNEYGPTDPLEIMADAIATHSPIKTYILSSGGNDSMVLLDWASKHIEFDAVLHVNTGTGVTEGGVALTSQFIRDYCKSKSYPFIELHPPKSYEQVFIEEAIIDGLPGPGKHNIAYSRLKERPLRAFVQTVKTHWRDRVMFLTGIRADESKIRMGYKSSVIDRTGSQVWVNPIYYWTNDEMRAYRAEHDLPQNPVAQHLHISGECLCGAFATDDELAEIEFFFPETAERIKGWESACRERGLTYATWGQRRGEEEGTSRMCQQCVGQMTFDGEITQDETRAIYRAYHEGSA